MAKGKRTTPAKPTTAGPHERTDRVFEGLVQQAEGNDTRLLLHALHWLCVVTVEVGIGLEMEGKDMHKVLTGILDKLDSPRG
jgi:hypothetical protein